jgi:DNA-binding PadR family transcriptional regulator
VNIKGNLPLLILYTLSTGPKHGYRIAKEIKQKSDGMLDFAEGTLYPTLHDLEKQGLIDVFEEEKDGRVRRCYRLTSAGHEALASERGEWIRYSRIVNLILGVSS